MNPQHKNAQMVISMTMVQALRSAMDTMLERGDDMVVFSQDVGYLGDMFRRTEGLQRKYDTSRVFGASTFESGIIGAAVGMGAYGLCPVVEIQFAGHACPTSGQLISEATYLRYRSVGDFIVPMTVYMSCGGGICGGQTRSQNSEAVFTQVCSLRTITPSNSCDAKGLLITCIENDDLVIFLESKRLYNDPFDGHHGRPVTSWSKHPASQVSDGYYKVPLDKAAIVYPDAALIVLICGAMVYVAQATVDETGLDAEIIDLRSLRPLDLETIVASMKRTSRCVTAHEATRTCGFGTELMSLMQEHRFHHLKASIGRVTGWDTPYPYAQGWAYFPGSVRVSAAFKRVMEV